MENVLSPNSCTYARNRQRLDGLVFGIFHNTIQIKQTLTYD